MIGVEPAVVFLFADGTDAALQREEDVINVIRNSASSFPLLFPVFGIGLVALPLAFIDFILVGPVVAERACNLLIAIVRVFGISPFSSKWLGGKPSLFPSASPLGEDCRANGRATAGNVTAGRAAAFAREQSRVRPRGATRRREPDTRADWLGQQAMGGRVDR
jgi:hypothetical protein